MKTKSTKATQLYYMYLCISKKKLTLLEPGSNLMSVIIFTNKNAALSQVKKQKRADSQFSDAKNYRYKILTIKVN